MKKRDIVSAPVMLLVFVIVGVVAFSDQLEADVTDYINQEVVSVQLRLSNETLRDPELLRLIETDLGKPLVMQDVRESLLHLVSLGRFEDVQVEARLAGRGVSLAYWLTPVSIVSDITFRGDLGLSESVLRSELADRFGVVQPGRINAAVEVLVALYHDRGYMKVSIVPADRSTGSQAQIFNVVAGPRVRIGAINLSGRAQIFLAQLLDQLDLEAGAIYSRVDLDRRITEYVAGLRARGHYEATVEYLVVISDDRETVDLFLDVHPGPVVIVAFEGDLLSSELQENLKPIQEEGTVDEDLLEDSTQRIMEALREQGYWKASVEYRRVQTADELTVTFSTDQGSQYRVERVDIQGNRSVSESDLRSLLKLQPGALFVESVFEDDIATLMEHYRGLGFVNAIIRTDVLELEKTLSDLTPTRSLARVSPRITIVEDVRVLIDTITFAGSFSIDESDLRAVIRSVAGSAYYRPRVLADQDALLLGYLDRGYREASVEVNVQITEDRSRANVTFVIAEGPQVLVDHVIVIGNRRTDRSLIEGELLLKTGQPLGLRDVIESQRRLRALGLFRSVAIDELIHTDRTTRDILVTVEEAPATSLGYGGGLEAGRRLRRSAEFGGQAKERFEFAPRGFLEVGRKNLWGKNRSIDLFMRASVRRDDDIETVQDNKKLGLNEYRVLGTYREPRPFGLAGDVLVAGVFEQAIRSSFSFIRRSLNAEISKRSSSGLVLGGHYSISRTKVFNEQIDPEDELLVDRLFPGIRLSKFSGILLHDTRPDPLDPDRGILLGIEAEVSDQRIGSQVGFAKMLLQGFMYRQLPGRRRIILALGGRLGIARGFPREVQKLDDEGRPMVDLHGQPVIETVNNLPVSERFFAGGDTTVRGFSLDRLGDTETIDKDGFPKGGHGLIVLNAEVRIPVGRGIGVVGFFDAGNVFANAGDVSLGKIRGTVGMGIRYQSPIGPIRVDLGMKLDRRQLENGSRERLTALHVSIGQAF